uniref:Uncharacterized protein n=1 Tax=Rhizophora mucronata TaxID=61149 RepID=A0A2P2IQV3_RHIMU
MNPKARNFKALILEITKRKQSPHGLAHTIVSSMPWSH